MSIEVRLNRRFYGMSIQVEIPFDHAKITQNFANSINPKSALLESLKDSSFSREPGCEEIKSYVANVGDWLSHLKVPSNLVGHFDPNTSNVIIQGLVDNSSGIVKSEDAFASRLREDLDKSFMVNDINASSIPSGGYDVDRLSNQYLYSITPTIYDKKGQAYDIKIYNIKTEIPNEVKLLTRLYLDTFQKHIDEKKDKSAILDNMDFSGIDSWVVFIVDKDNPENVVGILKLKELRRVWPIEDLGPVHMQFNDDLKKSYSALQGGLQLDYIEVNRRNVGLAKTIIQELQKLPYEFITLEEIEHVPDRLYGSLGFRPAKIFEKKYRNKNFFEITLTWVNPDLSK